MVSNSLSLSDFYGHSISRYITNELTVSADMASETLQDSSGYYHVFPGQTTEGESRISTTWTDQDASGVTWTSATPVSTTWSEA